MNHVMCDLETLDTKPTSIILSIGACVMHPDTGEIGDTFYRSIQVDTCRGAGLTESESTKEWWEKQSEEAKVVLNCPNAVPLLMALSDFSTFLRLQQGGPTKTRLWGNGSDFDNVILRNAYEALGYEAPWRFYNNRCYRTVKAIMGHQLVESPREGTYHNALDDALHQARQLLRIREHVSWS